MQKRAAQITFFFHRRRRCTLYPKKHNPSHSRVPLSPLHHPTPPPTSFKGVDIALFSAGGSISKKYGPIASDAGCTVVDNSSAFRMTEGVPLVIPEVNPEAMAGMKFGQGGIIANPNCSTIIALVAVTPLHRAAGVKRMVVSTYQAASGAGQAAMEELELQTREALDGKPITTNIFPFQYAFYYSSPQRSAPSDPPSNPPSNPHLLTHLLTHTSRPAGTPSTSSPTTRR